MTHGLEMNFVRLDIRYKKSQEMGCLRIFIQLFVTYLKVVIFDNMHEDGVKAKV